jgi:hypothetical protein
MTLDALNKLYTKNLEKRSALMESFINGEEDDDPMMAKETL